MHAQASCTEGDDGDEEGNSKRADGSKSRGGARLHGSRPGSSAGDAARAICRGHQGTIGRIAWSPCGRFIATPSTDKTIRIWDANDGKCVAVFRGHEAPVYAVAWAGSEIVSVGEDNNILRWDFDATVPTSNQRPICVTKEEGVHAVLYSSGSNYVAPAGGLNVRLWNVKTWQPLREIEGNRQSHDTLALLASDPDGSRLLYALADSSAKNYLWDTRTGRKLAELPSGRGFYGVAVDWSQNGAFLALAGARNIVHIYDPDDLRLIQVLEGITQRVCALNFSHDAKILATLTESGELRFWETETWKSVGWAFAPSRDNYSAWHSSVAFDFRSHKCASVDFVRNTLLVWDVDREKLIRSLGETVSYTSAKVVLVGESNVGKSCLAMRLAEDRYPEDHEHGTTHGMRFWPMEAEELHPATKRRKGSGEMSCCGTLAGRMSIS